MLLAVGLLAVIAGAIAAVSGFGIGSLMTPLLLVWFPTQDAVAMVAIPHAVASTVRCLRLRRDVNWRVFRQFGIASAGGGLIGAVLQASLTTAWLTGLLGLLLTLAGLGEILRRPFPLPSTPWIRLAAGALSGIFGGLVGNQGGIRSAALLGFQLSPRQIVATATASAVLVDFARVPVYVATSGDVLAAHGDITVVASIGVVAGTFLGVPVLGRLSPDIYRRLLGFLLVLLGLSLLIGQSRLLSVG